MIKDYIFLSITDFLIGLIVFSFYERMSAVAKGKNPRYEIPVALLVFGGYLINCGFLKGLDYFGIKGLLSRSNFDYLFPALVGAVSAAIFFRIKRKIKGKIDS